MAEPRPRVLVVDDEAQMIAIVCFALETEGFVTVGVRSAEAAWRELQAADFDLVVLDVTLPGASGVQLCERIRTTSQTPVILLTARSDEKDRLRGLLAGADDYLTKPFSPRELALRALAVVRRTRGQAAAIQPARNGSLRVDTARRQASLAGRQLQLSDVELRLLACLIRHAGQVIDHRTLLNEVWQTGETAGGRDMIKTAIYRLRQQLGPEGAELIISVRSIGYLMPLAEASSDE